VFTSKKTSLLALFKGSVFLLLKFLLADFIQTCVTVGKFWVSVPYPNCNILKLIKHLTNFTFFRLNLYFTSKGNKESRRHPTLWPEDRNRWSTFRDVVFSLEYQALDDLQHISNPKCTTEPLRIYFIILRLYSMTVANMLHIIWWIVLNLWSRVLLEKMTVTQLVFSEIQVFFFNSGLWGYWHCGHSWPIVPASGDGEDDCGEADGM
jgi:hypothetical protein